MGKLVVFWSPWHGQAKVTASMAAVAASMQKITKERVVVTHSQFNMADLEGMFNRLDYSRRNVYYDTIGLSGLILRFMQRPVTRDDIDQCSVLLPFTDGLYLLPGSSKNTDAIRGTDTEDIIEKLLTAKIPEGFGWTFVDTASGNNALSERLIDAADVVVIVLSQNAATWDGLFEKNKERMKKGNLFFLLGGYEPLSKYSVQAFIREHSPYANRKNTGVIPQSVGYMDAVSSGSVMRFFAANANAKKADENAEFMEACRSFAEKLLGHGKAAKEKGDA